MYDLELDKIVREIKKQKAKQILLQLPDGLKNKANIIIDYIENKTNSKAFIWFGDCFGECDIPLNMDLLNIDLIIQLGHNRFNKMEW